MYVHGWILVLVLKIGKAKRGLAALSGRNWISSLQRKRYRKQDCVCVCMLDATREAGGGEREREPGRTEDNSNHRKLIITPVLMKGWNRS